MNHDLTDMHHFAQFTSVFLDTVKEGPPMTHSQRRTVGDPLQARRTADLHGNGTAPDQRSVTVGAAVPDTTSAGPNLIHVLFEEQVRRTPDEIGVVHGSRRV